MLYEDQGRLRPGAACATAPGLGPLGASRPAPSLMYCIAAMQPVQIDPESAKPSKRRNVKISTDSQSVAVRHRRERISERMRILQQMVPGGTKMDTASMLDEAIHYVKFLKCQVQTLELAAAGMPQLASGFMSGSGHQYYSGYGQMQPFMSYAYIWNN